LAKLTKSHPCFGGNERLYCAIALVDYFGSSKFCGSIAIINQHMRDQVWLEEHQTVPHPPTDRPQ
jgi:hypothetical protein